MFVGGTCDPIRKKLVRRLLEEQDKMQREIPFIKKVTPQVQERTGRSPKDPFVDERT